MALYKCKKCGTLRCFGRCEERKRLQAKKDLLKKMTDPDDTSWIKVKAFDEAQFKWEQDPAWEMYQALMEHHLKETSFLRSTIAELAQQLLDEQEGSAKGV